MQKDNFYIITGGPGGGKTTLLDFLASNGYPYVGDTAREIIRHRLSLGLPPRPDPATFASEMFYRDFENYISNSNSQRIIFFDRSFFDSAWLLNHFDPQTFHQIEKTHLIHRYNTKVFVTPPWQEIYKTDSERDQTFDQAVDVHDKVCNWYAEHKYELIIIPKDKVESRAKFLIDQIK